ncbi:MAG: alpha-glucan phosphorylase [Phycisphaeraceae bacterium]|nr:alpha-glucan phosphorylase [Phycisphaeraceae bacterium]
MLHPHQATIRKFDVIPSLPKPLEPLLEIAHNLWWSWHPEARDLFVRVDRDLWIKCYHNPVKMLGECPQERLDEIAKDEGFLNVLDRCYEAMKRHLERQPWLKKSQLDPGDFTVAYFCAEFGLTECLQIYSGGLGCLAGDHLKSASELGLPLIAIGLLYRNGYFQQYLNADGWQQEYTPDLDFANLPLKPVNGQDGNQIVVSVHLPGREVKVALWLVTVGRIKLYLLDTNQPENDPADRAITSQLYGGDMEMRIKQEIVLGIGGVRALEAIGIRPDICHMNEGHSAFLALERIRRLIEDHDISFDEARQFAAASHIFTTHTPVPAGIDRFPPDIVERYFKDFVGSLRLDMEGLLALGRENVSNKREFFSMAVLAIRTAEKANGVSELHGDVSRDMWRNIWPGLVKDEIPITHVTNGVHARSWLSGDLINLLDRYIGARWQDAPADQTVWEGIDEVPDEELWRVHERRRHGLIVWVRRKLRKQLEARGAHPAEIRKSIDALDPDAFTIGFARRFATYKRANLLFRNPDRLRALLGSTDRPLQILIAGKAHPADGGGKDLIRQIVHFARESEFGHRVVFVENYDINVARYLVQGCDIWLNTPRRGMEASGTSGMKAALNGTMHCSILDGWWDEAYSNALGWQIGRGESYADVDMQDDIESQALYQLLEQQILPIFYDRNENGVPNEWVSRMKNCIRVLAPMFNTNRMVKEYAEKLYLPALKRTRYLGANKLEKSIELAHLKYKLRDNWGQLKIESVTAATGSSMGVRDHMPVEVVVNMANLTPDVLQAQVYVGHVDNDGQICDGQFYNLKHHEDLGDNRHRYVGDISAISSGRYGFAVRIVPGGELFGDTPAPGMVLWDHGQSTATPKKEAAAANA